jgi:hypothetical protein
MDIVLSDERSYVFSYVQLLQAKYKLTDREAQIASLLVYRYRILESVRSKFSTKKKREEYDPMVELKKPDTLKIITKELDMDFDIFRNYIKILKSKQFFVKGSIAPEFIPVGDVTTITVRWKN